MTHVAHATRTLSWLSSSHITWQSSEALF